MITGDGRVFLLFLHQVFILGLHRDDEEVISDSEWLVRSVAAMSKKQGSCLEAFHFQVGCALASADPSGVGTKEQVHEFASCFFCMKRTLMCT